MHYKAIKKLKVNVKSLAEESRFNRKESSKTTDLELKNELTLHRRGKLRVESRYSQLALAFLRCKPYRIIENKTKTPVLPKKLHIKLKRFVDTVELSEVTNWLK